MNELVFFRSLIREGRIREVGPHAFAIYLSLRDRVWRRPPRDERVARYVREGFLVARLSTTTLHEKTGISKRSIGNSIDRLVEAGWIQAHRSKRTVTVFVLGKRSSDGEEEWYCHAQSGVQRDPDQSTDLGNKGTQMNEDLGNKGTQVWERSTPDLGYKGTQHPKEGKEEGKEAPRSFAKKRLIRWVQRDPTAEVPDGRNRIRRKNGSTGRPSWKDLAAVSGSNKTTPRPPSAESGEARPQRLLGSGLVKDEKTSRHIPEWELGYLKSARAKKADDRAVEYNAMEIVAMWRAYHQRLFEFEDVNLETKGQWNRAARLLRQKVTSWFGGRWGDLIDYVRFAAKRGGKLVEDPKMSPPKFENLLKKKKGDYPWMYTEWLRKRAREEKDEMSCS